MSADAHDLGSPLIWEDVYTVEEDKLLYLV